MTYIRSMSKQDTVKVLTPQGKVIALGAKAWREARTLRDIGYSEYREPAQAATFAPIEEARKPGRPKKVTNTESDADQA